MSARLIRIFIVFQPIENGDCCGARARKVWKCKPFSVKDAPEIREHNMAPTASYTFTLTSGWVYLFSIFNLAPRSSLLAGEGPYSDREGSKGVK